MAKPPENKKLWVTLGLVVSASFAVLGYYGGEIYRQAPPVPGQVISSTGQVIFTRQDIQDGQNVWQSTGGQEMGSIWGHGAYVAPDWSADWLHRESLLLLERYAQAEHGAPFADLTSAQQSQLKDRLRDELRANTYDVQRDVLTVSSERAAVIADLSRYYAAIYGDAERFDPRLQAIADDGRSPPELREAYAIATNTLSDPQRLRQLGAFFFWAAWSCTAARPGSDGATAQAGASVSSAPISYSNNWPPDALVGNQPTASIVLWSLISIVLLLAGIGALSSYYFAQKRHDDGAGAPSIDPLRAIQATPSMKATLKYFWVVAALMLTQVGLGAITAHYGVEGQAFYGIPLAKWLPYAVTRTWHTQLGIFWIATAWLATGLFLAPVISGHEPKFQRAGVNFLFVALLVIVVGSMFGTWYGTRQQLSFEANFWFGHQGLEYVDLGRFWQAFLFVGLLLWFGLMLRALYPALRRPGEGRQLLILFTLASGAIGLFYGAGLMWGRHSNLAVIEYWRWWVVHLWVEGFFEVFATTAIALLFTKMGLLKTRTATTAVIFATIIFLAGGILGTFHHLYFTGTPTAILALGASFSALEVVPLVLMGIEALESYRLSQARPWVQNYRWPILFFIAVAFWNLVGAGLFGFLINPPVALYFMQGLNTTAVHAHTALFGVYGMLGIGLMLFSLRGLDQHKVWRTGALRLAFWSINAGLVLMVVLSLLPIGLLQTAASVEHGLWYARSAEFLQTDFMATLRWLRVFGDVVFSVGIGSLIYFVAGLSLGWSVDRSARDAQPVDDGDLAHATK